MDNYAVQKALLEETQAALLIKNETVGKARDVDAHKKVMARMISGLIDTINEDRDLFKGALLFVIHTMNDPAMPRRLRNEAKTIYSNLDLKDKLWIKNQAKADDFAELKKWTEGLEYPFLEMD